MKVWGSSSQQSASPPVIRPTRPENLPSLRRRTFSISARFSTHQKPALCRVASYSRPGLPRPTTSLMRPQPLVRSMKRPARQRPSGPPRPLTSLSLVAFLLLFFFFLLLGLGLLGAGCGRPRHRRSGSCRIHGGRGFDFGLDLGARHDYGDHYCVIAGAQLRGLHTFG